ncbi:uncharacterized protein LOC107782865 [Nicotiana tabacum]|uniref:Uncharacterized protein LOC107782865 n=1 Tax=Nicotiana tabacum TaxID=4097 RepID=A0A1S3Z4L5_TOBAC
MTKTRQRKCYRGKDSNIVLLGLRPKYYLASTMKNRTRFYNVLGVVLFLVAEAREKLKYWTGSDTPETNVVVVDDSDGIPNSFTGIPEEDYPLVLTFEKFLLMLDGTIGVSYFERFERDGEISYDRFCNWYWPHFNSQLTKKLDPSRVFSEIICQIKGGLIIGDNGKLSKNEYTSMSEYRASTIGAEVREEIYHIFQNYEKMKLERGEYDLSDFVNDIHIRLKNQHQHYLVDFVYVDEVQDLPLRHIGLLKYVCRNVDEGFVFSGDTAQTIGRREDFRFEDVRNLFYKEFINRKEKGHVSPLFKLTQNFRTHSSVLRLAQSVITLLHYYFPQSIDILESETSVTCGVAPVLLKPMPGADENAIITIFGNSESTGGKIIGFGAEQVILVRDESAKKEVSNYIGRKALILTIAESKGLEFQDVLLYNFFESSPLRNQWRVIYKFLNERGAQVLSFPSFSVERHSVLCSELKQLYVAITRTRQKLWICESSEEYSEPMFDYRRRSKLVQTWEIDDSLAHAMQTSSTPEEWKSQGMKLLLDKKYDMALLCFEKEGEKNLAERAKAELFSLDAERVRDSNPEEARTYLRKAAEIFYSIGILISAAECFYYSRDFEQAGNEKLPHFVKSSVLVVHFLSLFDSVLSSILNIVQHFHFLRTYIQF